MGASRHVFLVWCFSFWISHAFDPLTCMTSTNADIDTTCLFLSPDGKDSPDNTCDNIPDNHAPVDPEHHPSWCFLDPSAAACQPTPSRRRLLPNNPQPTSSPTTEPTTEPTIATLTPTSPPTTEPTVDPTTPPSMTPTFAPSAAPTAPPTAIPTMMPTFPACHDLRHVLSLAHDGNVIIFLDGQYFMNNSIELKNLTNVTISGVSEFASNLTFDLSSAALANVSSFFSIVDCHNLTFQNLVFSGYANAANGSAIATTPPPQQNVFNLSSLFSIGASSSNIRFQNVQFQDFNVQHALPTNRTYSSTDEVLSQMFSLIDVDFNNPIGNIAEPNQLNAIQCNNCTFVRNTLENGLLIKSALNSASYGANGSVYNAQNVPTAVPDGYQNGLIQAFDLRPVAVAQRVPCELYLQIPTVAMDWFVTMTYYFQFNFQHGLCVNPTLTLSLQLPGQGQLNVYQLLDADNNPVRTPVNPAPLNVDNACTTNMTQPIVNISLNANNASFQVLAFEVRLVPFHPSPCPDNAISVTVECGTVECGTCASTLIPTLQLAGNQFIHNNFTGYGRLLYVENVMLDLDGILVDGNTMNSSQQSMNELIPRYLLSLVYNSNALMYDFLKYAQTTRLAVISKLKAEGQSTDLSVVNSDSEHAGILYIDSSLDIDAVVEISYTQFNYNQLNQNGHLLYISAQSVTDASSAVAQFSYCDNGGGGGDTLCATRFWLTKCSAQSNAMAVNTSAFKFDILHNLSTASNGIVGFYDDEIVIRNSFFNNNGGENSEEHSFSNMVLINYQFDVNRSYDGDLYLAHWKVLNVSDTTFQHNSAGGLKFHNVYDDPQDQEYADGYHHIHTDPTAKYISIQRTDFIDNSRFEAPALLFNSLEYTFLSMSDCTVSNNHAMPTAGQRSVGAVYLGVNDGTAIDIDNCHFINNTVVSGNGAAIFFDVVSSNNKSRSTSYPTMAPTQNSNYSRGPTSEPTAEPTTEPTSEPTAEPTVALPTAPTTPTVPTTSSPTSLPTLPTDPPVLRRRQLLQTFSPTIIPTISPTDVPTISPTFAPTASPTLAPTSSPTDVPTTSPTLAPTFAPTFAPTSSPTLAPSSSPTTEPTAEPTSIPTVSPTSDPTLEPTAAPTGSPTNEPTNEPTSEPTALPTSEPTSEPTLLPTHAPTGSPTSSPIDTLITYCHQISISNSEFVGNAANKGGAVYVQYDVDVQCMRMHLTSVGVQQNTASQGGGLYATRINTALVESANEIRGNVSIQIIDSFFDSNTANETGGGLHFDDDDTSCRGVMGTTIDISYSNISRNVANQFGAGVYSECMQLRVQHSWIAYNKIVFSGDFLSFSTCASSDCVKQHATKVSDSYGGSGAGIFSLSSSVQIAYNEFLRNYISMGNGAAFALKLSDDTDEALDWTKPFRKLVFESNNVTQNLASTNYSTKFENDVDCQDYSGLIGFGGGVWIELTKYYERDLIAVRGNTFADNRGIFVDDLYYNLYDTETLPIADWIASANNSNTFVKSSDSQSYSYWTEHGFDSNVLFFANGTAAGSSPVSMSKMQVSPHVAGSVDNGDKPCESALGCAAYVLPGDAGFQASYQLVDAFGVFTTPLLACSHLTYVLSDNIELEQIFINVDQSNVDQSNVRLHLSVNHAQYNSILYINITDTHRIMTVDGDDNHGVDRITSWYVIATLCPIGTVVTLSDENIEICNTEALFSFKCGATCPQSQYLFTRWEESCNTCPSDGSVSCNGGNDVVLSYAYWPRQYNTTKVGTLQGQKMCSISFETFLCPQEFCCNDVTGCAFNGSQANASCIGHRDGRYPFCGKCLEGYTEVFGSHACSKCEHDETWLYVIVPFIGSAGLLIYFLWRDPYTSTDLFVYVSKSLLNFYQVLPLLTYQTSLHLIDNVSSVFNFEFFFKMFRQQSGGMCIFGGMTGIGKLYSYFLGPAILMAELLVLRAIPEIIKLCLKERNPSLSVTPSLALMSSGMTEDLLSPSVVPVNDDRIQMSMYSAMRGNALEKEMKKQSRRQRSMRWEQKLRVNFSQAGWNSFLIVYTVLCQACMRLFNCGRVTDAEGNPSWFLWYSGENHCWGPVQTIFCIFFVLLCVFPFYILWRLKQIHKNKHVQTIRNDKNLYPAFCTAYNDDCWYYECVMLIRRITLLLVYSANSLPKTQQMLLRGVLSFLCTCIFGIHVYYQPFKLPLNNKLETVLLLLLCLISTLTMISTQVLAQAKANIIMVTISILALMPLLPVPWLMWRYCRHKVIPKAKQVVRLSRAEWHSSNDDDALTRYKPPVISSQDRNSSLSFLLNENAIDDHQL